MLLHLILMLGIKICYPLEKKKKNQYAISNNAGYIF